MTAGRWDDRRIYGAAAAVLGGFLLWYALWTIVCNLLVLSGAHFGAVRWGFAGSLAAAAPLIWWSAPRVAAAYAWDGALPDRAAPSPPAVPAWRGLGIAAAAFLLAFAAAHVGYATHRGLPYILACAVGAALLYWAARSGQLTLAPEPLAIGWRLPALLILLFGIYYLAHRIDGDDANFVNLASAAQHTTYGVFQVDTMLGDGPHPIHLPSYKFHSFELAGAVLASWTGLPTIAVQHLVLPAVQIPVLAAVVLLVLGATCGRLWLAGALAWLGFLFFNEVSIGGYGLHGLIRFYQGKGFLVTALLPAIAGLTARWMIRGRRLDLVGLALANACAVGFSANGIYGGPAASGLVGLAFVATDVATPATWRRALLLVPTFAWPAVAAALIAALHLAYPSEVLEPTLAVDQLDLVAWYGLGGRLTLALLAVSGVGLLAAGRAAAALAYLPIAMLLTLNPASWAVISAVTGNLGFRIFWSIPAAFLIAATAIALLRGLGLRGEGGFLAAGAAALLAGVGYVAAYHSDVTAIRWHAPDLKVIRPDYELARRLAARTDPACSILAPETYEMLVSMLDASPHPVFVRSLYMVHYRFTMPPGERATRDWLRRLVDGPGAVAPPPRHALATLAIPIGTVAVRAGSAQAPGAATLATTLGLPGPTRDGPLLVWSGHCARRPTDTKESPR